MTKTAALAATVVAAGMGITACGGGSSTGAHSTPLQLQTSTSSSATPSTTTTTTKATHRATPKQVSRDQARPKVTTRIVTGTSAISFGTVRKYDGTLAAGHTRVERAGVAGLATVSYRQQLIGQSVASSTAVKRVVTRQPVDQILVVGTKKAAPAPAPKPVSNPSTGGLNLANAGMWDRIAQCESGGNWSINTGNGYYGGLQFSYGTWLAYGGGSFAARADLASRAQQITIANKVYAASGLSAWGCAGAA